MDAPPKYKLAMVGASDDGDRIFCIYKCNNKPLVKGFYDFSLETFVVITFQTNNLQEAQTPEMVLNSLELTLLYDHDWEFKNKDKLIKQLNDGIKLTKKRKKKNKKKGRL